MGIDKKIRKFSEGQVEFLIKRGIYKNIGTTGNNNLNEKIAVHRENKDNISSELFEILININTNISNLEKDFIEEGRSLSEELKTKTRKLLLKNWLIFLKEEEKFL